MRLEALGRLHVLVMPGELTTAIGATRDPEGVAELGLEDEVDVVVGTLGKALGSYGAYACCSRTMAKWLVNTARTLIFSTAPANEAAFLSGAQGVFSSWQFT